MIHNITEEGEYKMADKNVMKNKGAVKSEKAAKNKFTIQDKDARKKKSDMC